MGTQVSSTAVALNAGHGTGSTTLGGVLWYCRKLGHRFVALTPARNPVDNMCAKYAQDGLIDHAARVLASPALGVEDAVSEPDSGPGGDGAQDTVPPKTRLPQPGPSPKTPETAGAKHPKSLWTLAGGNSRRHDLVKCGEVCSLASKHAASKAV
eukprot:s1091_g12.t1